MAFTTPKTYNYAGLYAYLSRAYKENAQGGGWRLIGATARADYLPNGSEGSGAEILISWHGFNLVTVSRDGLRLHEMQFLTKPMMKLINRIMADAAPGHELVEGTHLPNLVYNGEIVKLGISTGWHFADNNRFYEVNGRTVDNYTKEDN